MSTDPRPARRRVELPEFDAQIARRFGMADDVASVILELGRLVLANERLRSGLYAELGLSSHELSALTYVGLQERATPKGLAASLSITTGSTTALIDRMVKADLLTREPHPSDRRSVVLTLAPQGRRAMKVVVQRYVGVAQTALTELDGTLLPGITAMQILSRALSSAEE
ncbi:MarR family transcriptional regulator [Calidifontibacter sp. DB0510]|uniref:MarR family transcriptional regulator n=1 Tax=Metallococcus carri TaxID=1656884 RepID=A0A967B6H3_9MICO|nr:MarR family transcriptional regulator [Metallococcus carri]NHN56472.1 MarR family transcriptional regulator [Metallococcus carri]NOP36096.1 MarR family transcriptional regulator [Calidifontibacter sp. DB2511S]